MERPRGSLVVQLLDVEGRRALSFLANADGGVARYNVGALEQFVAGERGIARLSTNLVRRGLRVTARAT